MKVIFRLVLLAIVIAAALYLIQKLSFPVAFKVCDLNYKNCQVIAKFKDRYDCEITKEYWGWYCDSTNKNNITCKEKDSNPVSSFCD